jgi:4-hydroxymandelate oxidase
MSKSSKKRSSGLRPRKRRQSHVTEGTLHDPDALVNINEWEQRARERMDEVIYDYCVGGACDERTITDNVRAFDRVRFRPRLLVDTSRIDLGVDVLGDSLAMPILVAPMAFNQLVHPDGELAIARAAAAVGTAMVVSTMSSVPLEDIARASQGPRWFQVYVFRDRAVTRALVQRAEATGHRALVLTVDAPRLGRRERDIRNGLSARPLAPMAAAAGLPEWPPGVSFSEWNRNVLEPALTWDVVDWLRSLTSLPVVLKGIIAAPDAERAIQAGISALIVSNHGGRQLDGTMATLDALPAIVHKVAGRCPVLLDGGVRRGTDVLAALAFGAAAVLVGRPCLWGLAVRGEAGVRRILQLLRNELELALALAGCPTIGTVTPQLLATKD